MNLVQHLDKVASAYDIEITAKKTKLMPNSTQVSSILDLLSLIIQKVMGRIVQATTVLLKVADHLERQEHPSVLKDPPDLLFCTTSFSI